jgi:tetratricopeptide (TPR) repeat protein
VVSISLTAPSALAARAQSRAQASGERQAAHRKAPEEKEDALAVLDRKVRAAEATLREGELQRAESLYRTALFEAWMMLGSLHIAAGRMTEARYAFERASRSVVEADAALQALAVVDLQTGRAAEAVNVLTRVAGRHEKDVALQRLLAQAQMANGQLEEAVQAFETARATDPGDPELAFLLGSAYLRVRKFDAAERLFAEVAKARPGASTDVLLGRTYRDAALYDRARVFLHRALKTDPRVRRAHYYLGTVAVLAEGVLGLDTAIGEFKAELELTPQDVVTNLRLGMALVEAQRAAEALPYLEIARASEPAPAEAFYYLGRSHLALNRASDAVDAFRRALSLAGTMALDEARVGNIHYQLAIALRQAGRASEATGHFEEARRASARRADSDRETLSRYMADAPEPLAANRGAVLPVDSPLAPQSREQRAAVERQLEATIARAYTNLGVMHAQAQRFGRAADMFGEAAALDEDFPQVQYSLGVAYFSAQQYDKATGPLTRALDADPANAVVRRMLGLAWFHSENYEKAAELIGNDPARESDPSLQYAYALALVRSGRASLAEPIFARLIEQHGNRAELHVVIGQAHAHQGDYGAAIDSLNRALKIEPGVAEANTTLGIIYLKQGRIAEARAALHAGLAAHPNDVRAQHTLATVLDLEGRLDEALAILRPVVRARPDFADGRYLLGKILLAQGAAEEAVGELQAAIRLSPEDANAHYQLGQAYQKLGQTDLADKHFTLFKQLKDKRRGGQP